MNEDKAHIHICTCTYTYTSFRCKCLVIHHNLSDFYLIHCVSRAESSALCYSSKPEGRRTEVGSSFSCSSHSCHWAQMTPLSSPLPGSWQQTASILRVPAGLSSSRYPHGLQRGQAIRSSSVGVQPLVLASWLYHSGFAPFVWLLQPFFLPLLFLDSLLPFHNFLVEHFWAFWKMSIFIHIIHYFLLKLFSIFFLHLWWVFHHSLGKVKESGSSVPFPESPQCSEEMTCSGLYSVPTNARFVPREDSHPS